MNWAEEVPKRVVTLGVSPVTTVTGLTTAMPPSFQLEPASVTLTPAGTRTGTVPVEVRA